jgi:membrane fusion protein, multidrug efflux system
MILVALTALVAVMTVASGRDRLPPADAAPLRVLGPHDVAVAAYEWVEAGMTISGSLEPYRVVEVRAQLPGIVDRVLVDRGIAVRQGQPLAFHDAATVNSQLAGAEAAVAAAQSAAFAAMQDEDASETLFASGAIAERTLRLARSAAAAARAELKAAEARLVEARQMVDRARVVTPIAGIVSRRAVSAGEAVNPGQPLFTIVDIDTLELAARVPAHAVAELTVGGHIVFAIDGWPGRRFEGYIARIDAVADPATRQVTVYAYLPNHGHELVGGLHATGRILSEAAGSMLTVPGAAIRGSVDAPYVLAVHGDIVRSIQVVTGTADPVTGRVAIRSGLLEGDIVVIGPADGLDAGTAVRLTAAPAAAAGEVVP